MQTYRNMKTAREIEKIKAVVLYILQQCGGTLDLITLFKKMYFSQQLYASRYGKTIFNDSFRAKRRGPVPSFTYHAFCCAFDGLDKASEDIKGFDAAFEVFEEDGKRFVKALENPEMKKIAGMELDVLRQVLEQTKDMKSNDLSEKSHDKAWKDAHKRAENDPKDDYISIVNIAKAGGASKEVLNYIRQKQQMEIFCAK